MRFFVTIVLMCFAAAVTLTGQGVSTSQIAGVVRDSGGGVLPGVEVTVVKTDTGLTRTAVTEADGSYVFPNLPVGPYKLTAVLQGFHTFVQDGIVLQVQSNPTIDVMLEVGGVTEQVSVV
ncbi:MAG: carboxypeptidase-like regulatory domain-containing protein, partial [Acidobacteriota bacterium]